MADAQPDQNVQPVQPVNDGNNSGDSNVPIHYAQVVLCLDGGINLKVK